MRECKRCNRPAVKDSDMCYVCRDAHKSGSATFVSHVKQPTRGESVTPAHSKVTGVVIDGRLYRF